MTEAKAESKDDDSDSEQQTRGADAGTAVASQPQRVALFPGVDPSALKVSQHLFFHHTASLLPAPDTVISTWTMFVR